MPRCALCYVGGREFKDIAACALRPGGIVVPTFFPALRAVRYEEPMAIGDFGQSRVRVVR